MPKSKYKVGQLFKVKTDFKTLTDPLCRPGQVWKLSQRFEPPYEKEYEFGLNHIKYRHSLGYWYVNADFLDENFICLNKKLGKVLY